MAGGAHQPANSYTHSPGHPKPLPLCHTDTRHHGHALAHAHSQARRATCRSCPPARCRGRWGGGKGREGGGIEGRDWGAGRGAGCSWPAAWGRGGAARGSGGGAGLRGRGCNHRRSPGRDTPQPRGHVLCTCGAAHAQPYTDAGPTLVSPRSLPSPHTPLPLSLHAPLLRSPTISKGGSGPGALLRHDDPALLRVRQAGVALLRLQRGRECGAVWSGVGGASGRLRGGGGGGHEWG